MNSSELIERVSRLLRKSYAEVPCWGLPQAVYGRFPLTLSEPVPAERVCVGDVVAFGASAVSLDAGIGIYLGSGKVVVSSKKRGVHLASWRAVKAYYLWGAHVE